MTKHFKAVHKETKGEIYFGLEDIHIGRYYEGLDSDSSRSSIHIWCPVPKKTNTKEWSMYNWLKDYELFYQHGGYWFKYG